MADSTRGFDDRPFVSSQSRATLAVTSAGVAGLILVVAVFGAGLGAMILLGAWAGRLTAHCMVQPIRNERPEAARIPGG